MTKYLFTALAASLLMASSALAQTPASSASSGQQKPGTLPVQPASPVQTAQGSAGMQQAPGAQKVDPEKEKAIRQLMELSGTAKLGDNMTEAVAFQVKNQMSRTLPSDRLQKFMDDFNQKLGARSPSNEVVDAEISTYAQHFSMEDLEGMIHFYQSPVGQRMAKTLPQVLSESQRSAADIERTAALATLKDMAGDYPELKSMLPPDGQKPSLGPGAQPQQPRPQSPQQQQPNPPQQ
jgi:uncharacterized protein